MRLPPAANMTSTPSVLFSHHSTRRLERPARQEPAHHRGPVLVGYKAKGGAGVRPDARVIISTDSPENPSEATRLALRRLSSARRTGQRYGHVGERRRNAMAWIAQNEQARLRRRHAAGTVVAVRDAGAFQRRAMLCSRRRNADSGRRHARDGTAIRLCCGPARRRQYRQIVERLIASLVCAVRTGTWNGT